MQQKVARGVTIPKPRKNDYLLVKAYQVILLLNCLGKMVKKVALMLVSPTTRLRAPSTRVSMDVALGSRRRGSSDRPNSGRLGPGRIAVAPLMDVAAAFPSAAHPLTHLRRLEKEAPKPHPACLASSGCPSSFPSPFPHVIIATN